MAFFPLRIIAEIQSSQSLPSGILQFGDGYEQLRRNTLDNSETVWDVKVVFTSNSDLQTLQSFLRDRGQDKVFQWQSPTDAVPQDYQIVGKVSGTKRNGGGSKPLFYTRSMQFRRYQKQSSLGISPISSATYSVADNARRLLISATYKSQKPLNLIPLLLSVQLIPGGGWRIVKASDVAAVINYSISVTPNVGTASTANYSISSLDSSLYEDISLISSSSGTQTLTILPGAYFISAPSSAQVVIPAPPVSVSSPNPTTWRISAELGSTVNYYIQGNRYDNSQFYSVGYSVLMNTNPKDIALLNLSDDNYARLGGSQTLYIGAGPYPILANGGSNKISVPPIPVQVGSGGGTWTISGPQNALVSYSLSVKNNVGGVTTNYPSNSVILYGGAAIVYPVNSPNSVQRLQILSGNPSYSIGTNYFSLLAY